jgi:hypothetical protein
LTRTALSICISAKRSLAAIDGLDLADSGKCLNFVKSPQIRGLDYPGASGLLAPIFKEWFGAVDHLVLESLCKSESLPEKRRIREIRARVKIKKDGRASDALLVIDIIRRKAVPLNAWFGTNRWTPTRLR